MLALIWLISASIRRMQRFGLLSIAVVMLTLIVAQRIGAAVGSSSSAMRLAWTAAELASLLLAVWLYRSQVEWSGVAAPKTDASPPTADK